ncbi:hypothetical protein K439DRAFT_1626165 [Ramaria rubella]|nr:hypothetical protein K439DRAFT_1626165 [Ramaria rubella]
MAPSVPSPTDPSRQDIIWLLGPRLIGIIFNWALLGLLTMQVYVYYLNFPRDRRFIKFLVYGLYVIDWVQTCSATYDAFQWFVYGWGDAATINNIYTTFLNVPALGSIIAASVQMFFGWRIYSFTKSKIMFGFIIFLALLQLGGAGAVSYFMFKIPVEGDRGVGIVRSIGFRLGGSALVDTVIVISMTYHLQRSKERAVGHLNNVLTRLVRLTVETGTVTAITAILDLVFFLTLDNGLHQVSGVILGKLYTNTLLVIFNNRMIMATKDFHRGHSDTPLSGGMNLRGPNHNSGNGVNINVTVESEVGPNMMTLSIGKESDENVTRSKEWI